MFNPHRRRDVGDILPGGHDGPWLRSVGNERLRVALAQLHQENRRWNGRRTRRGFPVPDPGVNLEVLQESRESDLLCHKRLAGLVCRRTYATRFEREDFANELAPTRRGSIADGRFV